MRAAGLVVARALRGDDATPSRPACRPRDLDAIARDVLARGGRDLVLPRLRHRQRPVPGVICASVNDRIVHGIPSADEKLADGDLISIDFGAIVDGWHGDAAVTVAVGEVSPEDARALSEACRARCGTALAAVRAGARLTDISHAVETSVRGVGHYGIVAGYGGHGIGSRDAHGAAHPQLRPAGKGPRLAPGMALAIEPMITLGSRATAGARRRLDRQHRRRLVGRALGAHRRDPRRRAVGAHRRGRRPGRARRARRRQVSASALAA